MARGRQRKTTKGQFDEQSMRDAVRAVTEEKISLRQAAERFKLKFQTVYEYVKRQKQNPTEQIRMAPNYSRRQIFSKEQEKALADYTIACAKMCYGQTVVNLKKLAYEMATINSCKCPENWKRNKEAGHVSWYLEYMSRHPQLSLRQPEGYSNEPSTSRCTEENINSDKNSLTPNNTTPKENQSKGTFISPQEFKGYPKAEERINKRKKREKARSIIATDTPEKIALEAKQKERERNKTVQRKNVKMKVVEEDSTDEETENATMLLTETSDDDIDFVEEINPPPLLDKLNKEPDLGDFVLTEFMDNRKKIYYIGHVLLKKDKECEVKFLRKSVKSFTKCISITGTIKGTIVDENRYKNEERRIFSNEFKKW
ncbi:hypothetical protein MML48_4g00015771 [Holotrichia oblita]|uniref:Uncharacterized protein n=1 Tax=Holotrichia oblita TaxID=644536 RepID=A0ACB9T883_HOLOL|nr:hypothetical protein MML48_4g00015771 [Holotrichia oblita]